MEVSKKYIIYTEMGYYAGRNNQYYDRININAKRYAYTFDDKESAYAKNGRENVLLLVNIILIVNLELRIRRS